MFKKFFLCKVDIFGYPPHKFKYLDNDRLVSLVLKNMDNMTKQEVAHISYYFSLRKELTSIGQWVEDNQISLAQRKEIYIKMFQDKLDHFQFENKETQIMEVFRKNDGKKDIKKYDITLCLLNIRSSFNVGSMIRSADGLGVKKLYLVGYTPDTTHRQVLKTSRGSEQFLEIEKVDHMEEILKKYKGTHETLAIECEEGSENIQEYVWSRKPILGILGNERYGIPKEIINLCDRSLYIPMMGYKYSLNVCVAMGIFSFSMGQKMKIL